MKRAQAVAFSHPYLVSGVYGVVRKGGTIKSWGDIDKPGINVGVTWGATSSLSSPYLKNAKIVAVAPPASTQAELMSQRVDAMTTDYPASIKVNAQFDWSVTIVGPRKASPSRPTPTYKPGRPDLAQLRQPFCQNIKLDGRLKAAAEKNKLGPIVAP